MKLTLVSKPALPLQLALDGQDLSGNIDGLLVETHNGGTAALTMIMSGTNEFELELPDDCLVNLVNQPAEVAAYVRTLDPGRIETQALKRVGFEGDCESLAEAMIATIADILEETDEASAGQGGEFDDGADDRPGLCDPPSIG